MNAPAKVSAFSQALAKFDGQINQVAAQLSAALPSHISVEKFQRTLMAAVKADPDLLRADRASLINACEKAALDGLLPDKREAALVIFKRSFKDAQGNWDKALEVQYMPMVYGLRKKILQSGDITDITAKVVYRREVEEGAFLYEEGTEAMLRHRPLIEMTEEDVGDDKIVAAYSMATYKDGTKSYEVMRRFEIDKVRESSQTGATRDKQGKPRQPFGPWVDWFAEQAKKTVMRRHSKTLPMSGDIIDIEGRELDAARSTAAMLSVQADRPVVLPGRDETDALISDQSGTESGVALDTGLASALVDRFTGATTVDALRAAYNDWDNEQLDRGENEDVENAFFAACERLGIDPDTGEVIERDPRTGMTQVDEETARQLDAGNDGTLAEDNPAAAEGPADEQRGEANNGTEEAESDEPVWQKAVTGIRGSIAAAKTTKAIDAIERDWVNRIMNGVSDDDVVRQVDNEIKAKKRSLQKEA